MPRRLSIATKVESGAPAPTQPQPQPDKGNLVKFPERAKAKNPAAVALGKLGGSKGGKIRAERLTPEERKRIAQKAAAKRWAKP